MKLPYVTLFSLYFAQSVPMSFFTTVVPVIMRQEQFSLQAIGLLQLVKLPWILKFLWAPTIDNHSQTRRKLRTWIISAEITYAVILLTIGLFQLETHFNLIVFFILLSVFASSVQDIATDIFAMRLLQFSEKPLGNALQSAGSFMGSFIGTGVLLFVYHYAGWLVLMGLLATILLLALVPLCSEKLEISSLPQNSTRVGLRDMVTYFKGKHQLKHLLLLVFYFSGLTGILAMLKPYMVDLGYSITQIGFASGILGTSTAALASLAGGFIIRQIGRRWSLYLFSGFNLMVAAVFLVSAQYTMTPFWLYAKVCLLWGAYGLSMVAIFTHSMDSVRTHCQGTDFTVQIIVTQLSSLLMAVLSGKLADAVGYQTLFLIQMILAGIPIIILLFLHPIHFQKYRFK